MKQYDKLRTLILNNGIFYLISLIIVFCLKCYYSNAGSNELEWILAPTARWVSILNGTPFARINGAGYVNHELRFLIAASCSGVQFMIITYTALTGSFLHHMQTKRRKAAWMLYSLGISYLYTIFINGLRILVSIHLPAYIISSDSTNRWLTADRLHTIIGTTIYFTALFIGYRIMDKTVQIMRRQDNTRHEAVTITRQHQNNVSGILRSCIPPLFWYFSIVLGIPLLSRAYLKDIRTFIEFVTLLCIICGGVVLAFCIFRIVFPGKDNHIT